MKYLFILSGDFIDLAKEEVLNLFDVKDFKIVDRLLIVDLNEDKKLLNRLSERLALTKRIYKLLFECKINELIKTLKNFDWNSIYKDNFCLRIYYFNNNKIFNKKISNKKLNQKTKTTSECKRDGSNPFVNHLLQYQEKDLAKYIWRSVNNPKVDLENPKTKIEIFIVNESAFCCLLLFINNENFEIRKSHLRPFPHPSSLHPKLAKALINITGIKDVRTEFGTTYGGNEKLLDPFCGTGGFLIEAGLMGIKCVGFDINKEMIKGCKENLNYFRIKNYEIFNVNALEIFHRFDYVVTDLPYGLNSNVILKYEKDWTKHRLNKKIQKKNFQVELENFYLKFLINLRKIMMGKAVIIFPDYVDYKKLITKSKLSLEKEFSVYVHRSLTRKIALLKNQ